MLSEKLKIVNMGPPVDVNGSGLDGDYVSLKNYKWATIVVQLGVTGAAGKITVEEAKAVDGTGAQAMAFNYRAEDTASGDTLGSLTAATAVDGITTSTNDNIFYIIEISAAELSLGYDCVRVRMSDPSAATLVSMCAVLSQARYSQENMPSAITD
ncbi:MAG: hypothetical protein JRG97_12925 [Deltaproteobacteria bacterium]|nr:hypothetical protein [Deltaproteobacteria bacterium]MBW2053368.1 hypothetical protein [Deltaproteobacteria bacterium]MBW2141951.1 hypothetical protein [Deltaproteobacteria bacterium]MBW2323638.1 hypothetical protein [Deltaproteobacteria bacterium]